MKVVVSIFSMMICSIVMLAQIDNKALYNEIKMDEKDSAKVLFSFANNNMLINNEYFGKILTGYTFFCSTLNPKLAYMPNKHVKIEGGILDRKSACRERV